MTREEALALARIVSEVDGVALLDPIRVEQRAPQAGSAQTLWAVFSHHNAPRQERGVRHRRSHEGDTEQAIRGFGPRAAAEFAGETYTTDGSILERELWVPAQRRRVLRFFVQAGGLGSTGPVDASPARAVGSVSEWRLRGRIRVLSWTMRVDELRDGERLVENQIAVPFRRFRHLLTGLDAHGGTLVRERLEYRLPWGVLGELADPLLGLTRALEDALNARYLATAREFSAR